jgi:site-specific DNA-methyltransferase (adenine-specific)
VNRLYYGDNLPILQNRDYFPDGSVDLVYLDPPFNSNATYNVLFKAPDGEASRAQIEAFEDTWHWNDAAEEAYWQVLHGANTDAARMLEAMRGFLGQNDMMAYLAMMAARLITARRRWSACSSPSTRHRGRRRRKPSPPASPRSTWARARCGCGKSRS